MTELVEPEATVILVGTLSEVSYERVLYKSGLHRESKVSHRPTVVVGKERVLRDALARSVR